MRKLLSNALATLGVGVAITGFAMALWYVFGDLPNPLPSFPHETLKPEASSLMWVFLWPVDLLKYLGGLATYLGVGAVLGLILMKASRLVLLGWPQFVAEIKEISSRLRLMK